EWRSEDLECPAVAPHAERTPGQIHLGHRLLDLLLHAFHRQAAEVRRGIEDGAPRTRLDREAEARGETNRAERPEPVLAHPVGCDAHRAHEAVLEVRAAVKGVAQLTRVGTVREGVDREIASREILVQTR